MTINILTTYVDKERKNMIKIRKKNDRFSENK